MKVVALSPPDFEAAIPRLGEILADAVNSGAGVSFLLPFTPGDGARYWQAQQDAVAKGIKTIFAALDGSTIAGTVILEKAWAPNQPHRGDIAKMLVHTDYRRKGVGKLLVNALIERAKAMGLTLLTFDTVSGSPAESFYEGLGFTAVGRIPGYALSPLGKLDDTTIFYMKL
jgi:GNAT superfamily N-acetyltransferase